MSVLLPRSHSQRLWYAAAALVSGVLLAALILLTKHHNSSPPSSLGAIAGVKPDVDLLAISLPHQGGPTGYITSAVCRECHPKQFETWHRSYHRQMTQVMTTNNVQARFDGVVMDSGGERFTLHASGDGYWVDIQVVEDIEAALRTHGAPLPAIRVPMQMMTGSHYFQVFWLPSGQGNQQIGFPFTWLIAQKRWVMRNDAFLRDPNQEQGPEQWNMVCIRCHATGARPMPNPTKQIFDTHITELGIACEACHGPGERHVALARTHRDEKSRLAPSEIVQPARLDHKRSSQVCGFCHSMKWFDESEHWLENGFRYRPGDDLEQTTPIIRPQKWAQQPWLTQVVAKHPDILKDFFWPDGMIRVTGREFNGLIESACYQKGELACVSCHSMHRSDPDKQLKDQMDGNRACFACHEQHCNDPTAHTHHLAGSSGSVCYNCHMPYTSYGLLRAVRSHQIERPTVQSALKTGRPTACNQCHVDKTLEWTEHYLSQWYAQPIPELAEEDRKISAVVKLLLHGDAGQRALAAFSLGWGPALVASGNDWEAPLLAYELEDPYAAVRCIAYRSLSRLPGFDGFSYDFESSFEHYHESLLKALKVWRLTARPVPARPQTLTGPGAFLDRDRITELLQSRSNTPVHLRE